MESKKENEVSSMHLASLTPNAEVKSLRSGIGLNALLDIIAEHLGDLAFS